MPIYEYKCKCCHRHVEVFNATPLKVSPGCGVCMEPMSRVFSFTAGNMMEERFDPSVGRMITSEKDLIEHGKRLSEEHSLRTGLAHNYVVADYTDKKTMGVTDEGLHEQVVANEKLGNHDLAKKIGNLI
jgi:hypothetical protein